MKVKPDDYFNNGFIEMARFGRKNIIKNNMTKEQHEKCIGILKSRYDEITQEINFLICTIKEKVSHCNPLDLLSFCSDMFLLCQMGISSEIQLFRENYATAHMTEYIQSIIVSTPNVYEDNGKDPSSLFFEIQSDVERLYELINEFYFSYFAKINEHCPGYDEETIKNIIESQFLYLVRGHRYQIYEFEYFAKLLTPHNNIFEEIFQLSANDIVEGIKKLQHALSQGKFDAINSFGKLIDSMDDEDDYKNPINIASGQRFVEKIFGNKLRDVIEVTGWSEKFVSSLSYEINDNTGFFSHSEFPGWPIIDLPVQKRPFIKIDNKYYCFDYYSFVDNFYRSIQKNIQRVNPEYDWADMQKKASEKMVADLFNQLLPQSVVYQDNYYPQNKSLKNMAENDIIVVYNDVLIIVEVKAGSFVYTPPFTDFESHIKSYKSLIEKADHQCKRTYDYLVSNSIVSIYSEDKTCKGTIDMKNIRDIYMMSVTIDNINSFAARAEKLNFLKLQCDIISIAVDDLMVYRDFFESPLLFMHFLKQRRLALHISALAPNDELDHLGLYINHNCYYMEYEDLKSDVNLHLIGYREDLDTYFNQLYHSELTPQKPELKIPSFYKEMLQFLEESHYNNKVEISNYLLDFATDAKNDLCTQLNSTYIRQKEINNYSIINASGKGDSLRYTCFVNQLETPHISFNEKRAYVLSQMLWNEETDRILLDFYYTSTGKFEKLFFYKYSPSDVAGEEKADLLKQGEMRAHRLLQKYKAINGNKIGRNELCPCGSGKKYKKCCIDK